MAPEELYDHAQPLLERSSRELAPRSDGTLNAEGVDPFVRAGHAPLARPAGRSRFGLRLPKPLTDEVVATRDVVVTMGCGDACPIQRPQQLIA